MHQTWITVPARATVLGRIRFESLIGRPLKLYALVDPAPVDDGNDDRGTSGAHQLIAFDDAAANVVAATPDLQAKMTIQGARSGGALLRGSGCAREGLREGRFLAVRSRSVPGVRHVRQRVRGSRRTGCDGAFRDRR